MYNRNRRRWCLPKEQEKRLQGGYVAEDIDVWTVETPGYLSRYKISTMIRKIKFEKQINLLIPFSVPLPRVSDGKYSCVL